MLLRLSTRASRGLLLTALAALLFLSYFGIRGARAAHAVGLNSRDGYQRAARIEPGDPHNWYLLGRFYQYDFEQPDPAAALHALLVARSLDPLSAETLLDLATNYDDAGKTADARAAYLEAKRVYPLSAEVLWRYGNFLLRQNEIEEAFPEIRKAVELDPKRGAEAFSRCRRVVPDASEILDRVIPPQLGTYLDIISDLANDGQLDVALQVWQRAKGFPGTLQIYDIIYLTDALIQANRAQEANRFWQQAAKKLAVPAPADPPGSAIWDGSFETGLSSGGFAWHFPPQTKGVQIKFDLQEKHSGAKSLQLMFTGRSNIYFSEVCHWAEVEPGKPYLLSAWVRTKALTTDQGIRFSLYSNTPGRPTVVLTQDVHGDQPWTDITLPWIAPPGVPLAQVCVVRSPSEQADGDISGIAWVDDVSLTLMDAGPNH
ncbi:MAG TPA: tetratricopeptide repeat protein [Candidatus Dormibacteraeota bacterium]|jgi:hypothetical protein|nr:tetratricopeptide repeat protein [Candidatus Dormibacteraeota bacterium]